MNDWFLSFVFVFGGFVPTLNFRYGKTYSKAADDSITEFSAKQRKLQQTNETNRTRTAPRLTSIRHKDEVARMLKNYEETHKFKGENQNKNRKRWHLQNINFCRASNFSGAPPHFWLYGPYTARKIQRGVPVATLRHCL